MKNSAPLINGKQRYAINGVSFVVPDTPLKLADNFNIPGSCTWDSIPIPAPEGSAVLGPGVESVNVHVFFETVFANSEDNMQIGQIGRAS
ncbi:hypothetical protein MAQ58_23290, partial [Enterobacter sp. DRP3]|nr:hypothetical protein [Enterobacter sp. DRP3]